jgi:hypothetical protein
MKEWPEKNPLLKEKNKQTCLVFAKRHVETPQTYGRRYSGQMRLTFSFLAIKENAVWRKRNTSHHPKNTMFFIGRDWETGQN